MSITIKTKEEIELLRQGGKILAQILKELKAEALPGVSTLALEMSARKKIKAAHATPAFLHYTPKGARREFPAALCISINDVVVHGIPNEDPKILKKGDIVTIDSGICFKKFYTDAAITVPCGEIDMEAKKLLRATSEALDAGIKAAKAGNTTGDVGDAIEKVAKKYNFSVADNLGGHGVGYSQHEDPFVPNFGMKGQGPVLQEGMVIAIEPIFNEKKSGTKLLKDGYTFVTNDGSRSAHFEHTVVVTKKSGDILTK
jgi:methionyl aminopeptidase